MDKPVTILFLVANPTDTARPRLELEVRGIDQALRESELGDHFEVVQHWAVRVSELQQHLLRHQPNIVHFSGHGSESSEIILEDHTGRSQPVSSRALSRLFAVLKDNIQCVVLNACYSEKQAQAIAEHIDCVIGMSKGISSSAAINFSTAFYRALAYGKSVKTAFDLGRLQIDLEGLDQQDIPVLLSVKSDPEQIVLVQHPGTSAQLEDQRELSLTVHTAHFLSDRALCCFINATNLSDREIEITHIWFDCVPQFHVMQPDRPLPKRLKPREPWATWVEVDRLPAQVRKNPYRLARARLSTGEIIQSQKNENVPETGSVPGGPILHRKPRTQE